jgi:hypothetical protein
MPNEKGYLTCRIGGKLYKHNEVEGQAHNVDVHTHCSRGTPVALVHTHNVNPNPSPQDLQTAKTHRLIVCVDFRGVIKCFKVV